MFLVVRPVAAIHVLQQQLYCKECDMLNDL